jgi:hypothetical protein
MTDNTEESKRLIDNSGAAENADDSLATAILRKKKKDNGEYFGWRGNVGYVVVCPQKHETPAEKTASKPASNQSY